MTRDCYVCGGTGYLASEPGPGPNPCPYCKGTGKVKETAPELQKLLRWPAPLPRKGGGR